MTLLQHPRPAAAPRAPIAAAGFLRLGRAQLAYVAHALRQQAELYRRNGMTPPPGIPDLFEALAEVSEGQASSPGAGEERTVEIGRVSPLLVSYSDAAAMLSISVSTLKRRLADGDLTPVFVAGLARIRVADLEAYVSNLPNRTTQETT